MNLLSYFNSQFNKVTEETRQTWAQPLHHKNAGVNREKEFSAVICVYLQLDQKYSIQLIPQLHCHLLSAKSSSMWLTSPTCSHTCAHTHTRTHAPPPLPLSVTIWQKALQVDGALDSPVHRFHVGPDFLILLSWVSSELKFSKCEFLKAPTGGDHISLPSFHPQLLIYYHNFSTMLNHSSFLHLPCVSIKIWFI